ncbi:MAG: lipopolysaccharide export system permease protein [Sphaerochaeta sp.]|nr:LptF/LptG family permease [Spirochaetaceae bacterium]MDK2860584.1 lipopolysaccharide export system permease protein [Sphaerochaeta sp.]MDN5333584.1 lipopolysaccharide export system permease protein [Sphaerochaeta sp.]
MKLHDRYVTRSVTIVALLTLVLCTLMLLSVDLFSNLDAYLTNEVSPFTILSLTLLYIPQAVLFALGPSLLFSAAYFLSQLQANNEYICLLGSGLSYRRIVTPILILGILFSLLEFGFGEYVFIPAQRTREIKQDELFGLRSTYDNRNITLRDPEGGYVVHAKQYSDDQKRLAQVLLVLLDEEGAMRGRVDAAWAYWEDDREDWRMERVRLQEIDRDGLVVSSREIPELRLDEFTLAPSYFRNLSNDITTMELGTATDYLRRMEVLDPSRYPELATDFTKRLLDHLNPLILLFIACTISYKYKKNVLLFSIITSLSIAVIYYVVQMVTTIMAKQGVIAPIWGMVIPMIVIVCIALAERAVLR